MTQQPTRMLPWAGTVARLRRRAGAAMWLCVFLGGTAAAYMPLPYDLPSGDDAPGPVERRRPVVGVSGPRRLFGTAGATFDWTVRPGGDLGPELSEGRGVSLEVPATLPGWLVYALIDPTAIFQTLSEEAWRSGYCGTGLRTSPVVDEVGFVFLYSRSTHEDLGAGGEAELSRYGLGVRLGGPGPEGRSVRGTASLGWAWSQIDFESRPGLEAMGPYAGAGLEIRSRPGAMGKTVVGFRLDARWDWPRGVDGFGGRFDARTFTAGAGIVFLW